MNNKQTFVIGMAIVFTVTASVSLVMYALIILINTNF